MNTYEVILIGDIAAASAAIRNEFCQVLGNLYAIKDELDELTTGLTAGTLANKWVVSSPYQYDLPSSNATVLYNQLKVDTVATKKLTTIQKSTLVESDLAVVLGTTVFQGELNAYTTQALKLSTGPVYLQIGMASDTQSTVYTPFATAIGKAYFGRAAVMAVVEGVQAARGLQQATAISLIQNGYV